MGPRRRVDERTVDVHIGRLRKALIRGRERDPIRTVRGSRLRWTWFRPAPRRAYRRRRNPSLRRKMADHASPIRPALRASWPAERGSLAWRYLLPRGSCSGFQPGEVGVTNEQTRNRLPSAREVHSALIEAKQSPSSSTRRRRPSTSMRCASLCSSACRSCWRARMRSAPIPASHARRRTSTSSARPATSRASSTTSSSWATPSPSRTSAGSARCTGAGTSST